MTAAQKVEVLIIGSGAGGAMTALDLATAGRSVCVIEEGSRVLEEHASGSLEAFERLYRNRGMTPILGRIPVGFVEGMCVGGSTEINSGFWHRTPTDVLWRWTRELGLEAASPADLAHHFEFAEELLEVSLHPGPRPKSTELFRRGADVLAWDAPEVRRVQRRVGRSIIPRAEAAGARILTNCGVNRLLTEGDRVVGVTAVRRYADGTRDLIRVDADHVFVCAGAIQTPALLRASGITHRVGETLGIHPMLKVAALFPERVDAQSSVLPLLQVKAFGPDITLGGAYFTPGHLAMLLSDNWLDNQAVMKSYENMASYYVAVRGSGRGSVRPPLLGRGKPVIRYELSKEDLVLLSRGLAHLARLLLAAGATQIHPAVQGLPVIRTEADASRWLDETLPGSALSLTTVHAFASCPAGGRRERSATDSFGKVHGYRNLYLNDASILPDSPSVNPQGTIMAFARRNAQHFQEAAG